MITETPLRPRRPWPLLLRVGLAILIITFLIVLGLLVYVLLKQSDELANGLSISSDDPLAVAEYHRSGDSPLIGDHWHAAYAIYIGEERQPDAPTWESGVHTHGDGIIHIHPFTGLEVGSGASLARWFQYGGGELTDTSMLEPGFLPEKAVRAGDPAPGDGEPGQIYVILNGILPSASTGRACDGLDLAGQWVRVPISYIPHDGDCIRIMFEPEEVMRDHIRNAPSVPSPLVTAAPQR